MTVPTELSRGPGNDHQSPIPLLTKPRGSKPKMLCGKQVGLPGTAIRPRSTRPGIPPEGKLLHDIAIDRRPTSACESGKDDQRVAFIQYGDYLGTVERFRRGGEETCFTQRFFRGLGRTCTRNSMPM